MREVRYTTAIPCAAVLDTAAERLYKGEEGGERRVQAGTAGIEDKYRGDNKSDGRGAGGDGVGEQVLFLGNSAVQGEKTDKEIQGDTRLRCEETGKPEVSRCGLRF